MSFLHRKERRFWPGYEGEVYTKAEWKMFIQEKHSDLNEALIEKETNRLWGMAKSRLCDQPITPWREILEFKARGGLVVVISSRRAYVAALKPALRKQGFIVTFGQPGDAMTDSVRSSLAQPEVWPKGVCCAGRR